MSEYGFKPGHAVGITFFKLANQSGAGQLIAGEYIFDFCVHAWMINEISLINKIQKT